MSSCYDVAVSELKKGAGNQLDPKGVEIFLKQMKRNVTRI